MSLLIVSPHLDDAVLSCGWLMAQHPGCIVITLFAGTPADPSISRAWDRAAKFRSAGAAIAARRVEDSAALKALAAAPHWLEGVDAQYAAPEQPSTLAALLEPVLAKHPQRPVVIPLGLYHPDHRLAADAAVLALRRLRRQEFLAYEDVPYRLLPDVLSARLGELDERGLSTTLEGISSGSILVKHRALAAYRSQWPVLLRDKELDVTDAFLPERRWRCRL